MKLQTQDGYELDVLFTSPLKAKKVVIFAHGLTVDKNDEGVFVRSAKKLNALGIATLLFDFRGHGLSSGDSVSDFTISGQLVDLETVLSFVQNQGFTTISIGGASFGGGAVALFSALHSSTFAQIVLVNPVLDYDATYLDPVLLWSKKEFKNLFQRLKQNEYIEIGRRKFLLGLKLFQEMKTYNPCESIRHLSTPLLVIHGNKDSKVDYETTKKCFDSFENSDKHFKTIEGAEHGFHEEPFETEVTEMIVEFLKIA